MISLGEVSDHVDRLASATTLPLVVDADTGFGNPVIESLIADRPVAVAWYPVLDELVDLGLQLFSVVDPARVAEFLADPHPSVAQVNAPCLEEHFDLHDLPGRIASAFATVGWDRW